MSVRAAFMAQADSCAAMDADFSARVLRHLADLLTPDTPLGRRILHWPGDPSARADALALRLLGGLHSLVLSGVDPDLAAAYADRDVSDAVLTSALGHAMSRHADTLSGWLDTAPQTNEVRRSAVLIAAGHWLAARFDRPLVLSELGASAGLNLLWDHYALAACGCRFGPDEATLTLAPDWRGHLPPVGRPVVVAREGVDLRPIDPVADRMRLLSYIWAGQPERMTRTMAALDLAARLRPNVRQADAVDWLRARLLTPFPGTVHLVYHTVAWQYLPPARQTEGDDIFASFGAVATDAAPLARFSMEADGGVGAALRLQIWPGGQIIDCGRADFHGRWVEWRAD